MSVKEKFSCHNGRIGHISGATQGSRRNKTLRNGKRAPASTAARLFPSGKNSDCKKQTASATISQRLGKPLDLPDKPSENDPAMKFKPAFLNFAIVSLLFVSAQVAGHERNLQVRHPILIPDVLGYHLLKCDFHIHTVFSDGQVWPDVRVEEAWREGLDVIAITDHVEYQPHAADVPTKHGRSTEIARELGTRLSLPVISGLEVTREMPPGHLNAIFLTDPPALEQENWRDALAEAVRQGAFIFWNHPGWTGQQPDGVARWYPEHDEILQKGWLHGIEVANDHDYYPEAHRWCLEKGLTMLSNSDIHDPIDQAFRPREGDYRPLTLVLARDRTPEAVHEALREHRTVVLAAGRLIGEERFVIPIFQTSVSILYPDITVPRRGGTFIQIENRSDIPYELQVSCTDPDLAVSPTLRLEPRAVSRLPIRRRNREIEGERPLRLKITATNVLVAPEQPLETTVELRVSLPQE